MRESNRSDDIIAGEALTDANPCVDLVPMTPSVQWLPPRMATRPDSSFVTQLIATAEQEPHTSSLRRATYADAQLAYGSRPQERRGVARRTRQII
jgi:hypothetical protein